MGLEIKLLKRNEINTKRWDECVANSPQAIIYGHSWYLDVVASKWEAIVARENGIYKTVMPVPLKTKLGIDFVYQPFFCQQLGIFSQEPMTPQLSQHFMDVFCEKYFYAPFYAFNCENNISCKNANLQWSNCHTHKLTLEKDYSETRKNYKRDRKYRLNQAKKLNVRLLERNSIEELIEIFRDDAEKKIPGGVHKETYELLRNLYEVVTQNIKSKIYYTQNENGELESGGWFVFYKNQIIYLFNAAKKSTRRHNGRTIIIDKIIEEYSGSDYILDFESPEEPDIAAFYMSFGSQPVQFQKLNFNRLPIFIKKLHQLRIALYRKIFS